MSVADNFRLPVREVLQGIHREFTRDANLIRFANTNAGRQIEQKISSKGGNEYLVELPSGYLTANVGPRLKVQSMAKRHAILTVWGQYHTAIDVSGWDYTFEIMVDRLKRDFKDASNRAFLNRTEDAFAQELTESSNGYFIGGDVHQTIQRAVTSIRSQGVPRNERLVMAASDNLRDRITTFTMHATNGDNMNQIRSDRFEGAFAGVDLIDSANRIPPYLTGDRLGLCPVVHGPCQVGDCLRVSFGIEGANRRVIRASEIFEIEGVRGVIEASQTPTGRLQQYIVECDIWADANGLADLPIWPHIRPAGNLKITENWVGQPIFSDAYQNVDKAPVDGARIRFLGEPNACYEQSVIWHKDAITNISPRPGRMQGVAFSEVATSRRNGITFEYTIGHDINEKRDIHRIDMYYETLMFQRQLAARIIGPKVSDSGFVYF